MSEEGSLGESREGGSGPAGAKRPRARRRTDDEAPAAVDLGVLLEAHRRHAAAKLPRGEIGVATAVELLGALVEACRRRLPDSTATAPGLMEFLVERGLMPAMPSPRVIPAAFNLVARVSPLLESRSARLWTGWFAQVHDAGSRVAGRIRRSTPASQLAVTEAPPAVRPLRSAALRADRDRLAAELAAQTAENEKLRRALTEMKSDLLKVRPVVLDAMKICKNAYADSSATQEAIAGARRTIIDLDIALRQAEAEIAVRKKAQHTEADVTLARAEAQKQARLQWTESEPSTSGA